MNVHLLISLVFISLQDGHTGVINAQIYTGADGDNITVRCSSASRSAPKFFCKEECKQEDILIETTDVRTQKGRYTIEWRKGQTSVGDFFVSISQLTKSDSGGYRCGVGRSLTSASFDYLEIIVVDALLDRRRLKKEETTLYARPGGSIMVACYFTFSDRFTVKSAFLCKGSCMDIPINSPDYTAKRQSYTIRYVEFFEAGSVYVTIPRLTKSDSGKYTCGVERAVSKDVFSRAFEVIVTDDPNLEDSTSVPSATTSIGEEHSSSKSGGYRPPSFKNTDQPATITTTLGGLLYVNVILVITVIVSALVLGIVCIRRKTKPVGLNTRRNLDGINIEIPCYENLPRVSTREDSTYESLNPATRDQNNTYSALTYKQHT